MSKILILNGGARLNGNTAALIDAFTAGAESAGNEVVRFDLQHMNIHDCKGCLRGGADKTSPCVQKDDMDLIYPHYQTSDVIVLASPMYYWSISGVLKCAIDRLYAMAEIGYMRIHKTGILLMAAGDGSEPNFAPTRTYFNALVQNMTWKNGGIVYAGGNSDVGDIKYQPKQLEEARKLGASIR